MKQYVIDELRPHEHALLKDYLDERHGPADLGGIYWIALPEELLTEEQARHSGCLPLYLALELQEKCLACELLVRTKARVRCSCIRYATSRQREWIITKIDAMVEKLQIPA